MFSLIAFYLQSVDARASKKTDKHTKAKSQREVS